jgi:transcriptional regulator with XRE-family HTH domain
MEQKTADALKIIRRRFYEGKEERLGELEDARVNDDVARKILELREAHKLSQRALADLVGTTASVICRLEDADYDGHSLGMLNRIARALNHRISINFVALSIDGGSLQPQSHCMGLLDETMRDLDPVLTELAKR